MSPTGRWGNDQQENASFEIILCSSLFKFTVSAKIQRIFKFPVIYKIIITGFIGLILCLFRGTPFSLSCLSCQTFLL